LELGRYSPFIQEGLPLFCVFGVSPPRILIVFFDLFHPVPAQSEKFIPTQGFDAALECHGTDGPLRTTVHPLAPISDAMLESYVDKGFEYKPDMFVTGEGEGVGHATRTVHEGLRTSG